LRDLLPCWREFLQSSNRESCTNQAVQGRCDSIDYDGRSVLLSGDTRLSESLIRHGDGVDLLIHEVFTASAELLKNPAMQHILSIHTTPSQAGTVFTRTHPKLAVYTHIVTLGSPTAPPPSVEQIVAETRQTYKGPLVVGEDLMTFDIGEGGVSVARAGP